MTDIVDHDSHHALLGPDDDGFHPPDGHPWFHETSWFSFVVPERKLGAWIYNWVRPARGLSGGGLRVWDDSAFFHMEVPYYCCPSNLRLPADLDLRHATMPSGTRLEVIEPLMRYRLGYRDRDVVDLDLTFDATMPPWVEELVGEPAAPHHFDQVGRVHGTVTLRGEEIPVDCLAMRDRSWSPRSEVWKVGNVGYTAAASPEISFLVRSAAGTRGENLDRVRGGFVQRDGVRARIVEGTRAIERHPQHGYLERITLDVVDTVGRTMHAVGAGLSRMAMPIPGVHGVSWTSLVRYDVDGTTVWGDDQDAWALHEWAGFRRASRLRP